MRCSMPRRARIAPGEIIYHALNRANGRSQLFDKPEDYAAFERIMVAAMRRAPIRLLAYCLMPNHWHMVLWPKKDGEMTEKQDGLGRTTLYPSDLSVFVQEYGVFRS